MGITVERIIKALEGGPRYKDRIEHIEVLPAQEPRYGELTTELPINLQRYLAKKRIALYQHQCDALNALRSGKNVVITTPTASGKTLAFNVPIFETLLQDKRATALYLYPTKALSNDQLKVIKEFEQLSGILVHPEVYDGDTPTSKRPKIRETARIIISNPYELHHVLPWHYKWQKFLSNLKFVVIDEGHIYRGVFGSNVAFLLRRLRRLCNLYGSDPQFILSTATLANPIELGEKLIGCSFDLIAQDGSPKGKKYFIFYNPYFGGGNSGELSTHQETKSLLLFFVRSHLQTLCFTVSRKMAELIALWSKMEVKEAEPHLVDRITAYRAGYLPEERREIENNLKNGTLLGVTSTNALELGIDIGSLDSVIISGYPGTIISTWQQAGRSGRGIGESITTLVAFQNPLDQYFMKHPEIFFGRSSEHAIIDLSNYYIVLGHLMCAAAEAPITAADGESFFGETYEEGLRELERQGLVQNTLRGWVYSGKGRATEVVRLDALSSDTFNIICNGKLMETIDRIQAYREAHNGAVLLHQGETYIVEDFNLNSRTVHVKKRGVDFHTEPMKTVDIEILHEIEQKEIGKFVLSFGDVNVTERYVGYKILRYDRVMGIETLDLPPLHFKTTGLWFTVPDDVRIALKEKHVDFAGGLHGIEHAMIGIMPFYVMCDRWDIGGVSTPHHPDTANPTVFIYDGFEGGIGLTENAFELIEDIIKTTIELVRDCNCESGCPACIYSPKCGNENKPLDKKGTILLLEKLLRMMNVESAEAV